MLFGLLRSDPSRPSLRPLKRASPALPAHFPYAALLFSAALWTVSTAADAHELEVDQLRLWLEPSGQLRGQLLVDPELTRGTDEQVSDAVARTRVQEFAARNLAIAVDGVPCNLEPTLRELYVLGGAAPADIVMLQCSPEKPIQHLELVLSSGFKQVSVEAVGFAPSGVQAKGAPSAPELVPGGTKLSFTRRSTGQLTSTEPDTEPSAPGSQSTDGVVGTWFRTAAQFLWLGVEHIVPGGLDHVLFVVGLALRQSRWRVLLLELLTFTLAHTLTLVLATYGWVVVSPRWVEPLIALSIVVVALLNLRAPQHSDHRARLGLCFGFGLVHGLGFAGALSALGMAKQTFVPALLGFNLGVELGQVLVACCAVALLALLRRKLPGRDVSRGVSVLIAVSGLALLLSRLF